MTRRTSTASRCPSSTRTGRFPTQRPTCAHTAVSQSERSRVLLGETTAEQAVCVVLSLECEELRCPRVGAVKLLARRVDVECEGKADRRGPAPPRRALPLRAPTQPAM